MSAREELHESMCNCGFRSPAPGECASTDQLIDNYAHELAENIRAAGLDGGPDRPGGARVIEPSHVDKVVQDWPPEVQEAFWSAVNAPTYSESAAGTAKFAVVLAHSLAEHIRNVTNWSGSLPYAEGRSDAADLIDPDVA